MSNEELKARLNQLIEEAKSIYDLLDSGGPALPQEAVLKWDAGICLRCGKPMSEKERKHAQRGCHMKCYRQNTRLVKDGKTTDGKLIEQGLWAPARKPGRKPTQARRLD